jgi:hypothetical protein
VDTFNERGGLIYTLKTCEGGEYKTSVSAAPKNNVVTSFAAESHLGKEGVVGVDG